MLRRSRRDGLHSRRFFQSLPSFGRFSNLILPAGTFAALYKFLINALPILIPAIKPRPSTLSNPFEDDEDEEMALPRTVSYPASGPATPHHLQRRRSARLSLSAAAHMVLVRKRTRRWHSALAGAIAGSLAILWEKRNRRGVIGQQMFVRYVHELCTSNLRLTLRSQWAAGHIQLVL